MIDDLVRGLFDYAGMFPPAALTFEEALQESAILPRVLHRPHILGADLVLASKDLPRLDDDALAAAGFERSLRLCVVGFGPDGGLPTVDAALHAIEGLPPSVRVVALEPMCDDPFGQDWLPLATTARQWGARLYIEPRWDDAAWQTHGGRFWSLLATLPGVGAKFRCAGPTGLDQALADVLEGAARTRVPLKATQGLHHPHPGPDRHGFLNVAAGLRLVQCGLPTSALRTLLADDDASSFTYDPLGWRTHKVLAQRVAQATQAVPFAIGSCSLAEPDEELASLVG